MLFSTRSNDSQGLSWKGPIFYQYKDIYYSKLCHLVAKLCLTLCNPMDCSLPGSSVLGILQAKLLEWVAIPVSKGCSQPRNQTWIFRVSCTGKRIFYHWSTRDSVPFLCLVQCTLSANNCLSPHVTKKCIVQLLLKKDFIWLRSYNRQKKKKKKQKKTFAGLLNSIQSHDSMLYRKSKRQRGGGDQKKIFFKLIFEKVDDSVKSAWRPETRQKHLRRDVPFIVGGEE